MVGELASGESKDRTGSNIYHVRDEALFDFVLKHAVLVWAGAAVAILVVRVFIEVRGNREAALALLQGVGAPNVVVALLVNFVPYASVLLMWLALAYSREQRWPVFATIVTSSLSTVVLAIAPWWLVLGSIGAVILLFLLNRIRDRRAKRQGKRLVANPGWIELSLLLQLSTVVSFVLNSGMWAPAERLTFTDGVAQTAYVVNVADGWATLLVEPNRAVGRRLVADIKSREICQIGGGLQTLNLTQWIATLVGRPPPGWPTPPC